MAFILNNKEKEPKTEDGGGTGEGSRIHKNDNKNASTEHNAKKGLRPIKEDAEPVIKTPQDRDRCDRLLWRLQNKSVMKKD